MRDQLALMQVNYEELRVDTFNKKEGALQALVEASYQLIGSDKPSPLLFSQVLQTARLLEMTHNFAEAKQVFDLLELAGRDHPNAELVNVAELSVRSARKRISLLGQPIVLAGSTLAGTEFDWTPYQGKYTLVVVWSTRWSDSLIHFPAYDRVLDEYADHDLMVLGINLDEDVEQAKAFKQQLNLRWPSIVATVDNQQGIQSPLAKQLGADAPPYTFLIDPNGNIVKLHLYADDLFATLDEIFGIVREPETVEGNPNDASGQQVEGENSAQNAAGGDGQ
jgi:peroxiredoxin